MPTAFIEVVGPKSLASIIAAIEPSAPPTVDRYRARIESARPGLKLMAEYDKRRSMPFIVEVNGRTRALAHGTAERTVKRLRRKRWTVSAVPSVLERCPREEPCSVCWDLKEVWDSKRILELTVDAVAASDLCQADLEQIDDLIASGDELQAIAVTVLSTRTPLDLFTIGRVRQLLDLGRFAKEAAA